MRNTILLSLVAGASLFAQVTFSPADGTISIDGKPFAVFHDGADANKPFIAPIRSASGKIITRGFPMEKIEGESHDHLHHRGLWFSYDDVNGVKFWENDPSYTKGKIGKIVVTHKHWDNGKKAGTLTSDADWNDPDGKTLLVEHRVMKAMGDAKTRILDFDITLTASQPVTFGDTKEGAFAIRLAEPFTERKGAKLTDADGRSTMKQIWGKRSNWVNYEATVDGEDIGVAIFDHPRSARNPTYWHARDYGLFALNPFGRKAFDPAQEESKWALAKGEKVEFRWRVVIHSGDADIPALYKDYAATK